MTNDTRFCEHRTCTNEIPAGSYRNKRFCSGRCRSSEHFLSNPAQYDANRNAWAAANAEKQRSDSAAYYAANRERVLAYQAVYYRANRETYITRATAHYEKNRERLLAHYRAKTATGAPAARARERRAINPLPFRVWEQQRRARLADAPTVAFTAEQMAARLAYFGRACWMCSGPFESIDHVKPLNRGGSHMLSNLRPACNRCNSSKRDRWYGAAGLSHFMK